MKTDLFNLHLFACTLEYFLDIANTSFEVFSSVNMFIYFSFLSNVLAREKVCNSFRFLSLTASRGAFQRFWRKSLTHLMTMLSKILSLTCDLNNLYIIETLICAKV